MKTFMCRKITSCDPIISFSFKGRTNGARYYLYLFHAVKEKLDYLSSNYFPYLDTFRYLNTNNCIFSNSTEYGHNFILKSSNGSYEEVYNDNDDDDDEIEVEDFENIFDVPINISTSNLINDYYFINRGEN